MVFFLLPFPRVQVAPGPGHEEMIAKTSCHHREVHDCVGHDFVCSHNVYVTIGIISSLLVNHTSNYKLAGLFDQQRTFIDHWLMVINP